MTLIIAGYEHGKDEVLFSNEKKKVKGIFAHADSAITSGSGPDRRILLTKFQKLYPISVKLWKPYFAPGGVFTDYREVYSNHELIVGFAGSTLTAQHILNAINEHTNNLRITHSGRNTDGEIVYDVKMPCSPNLLYDNQNRYWGDCTFNDRDFVNLLTGDFISDCLEHAINHALASASQTKMGHTLHEIKTDLLSAFWCPKKQRHELYVYKMKLEQVPPDNLVAPRVSKEFIHEKQVAVLGMESQFAAKAQSKFDKALAESKSPSVALREFLSEAIHEVKSKNGNEISDPVYSKCLSQDGKIVRN